eukprot:932494-Amorphochlora_amoeboformis.AAC.2
MPNRNPLNPISNLDLLTLSSPFALTIIYSSEVERAKSAGVGTKRKREAEKQPGTKKMRHIEGSSTHGKAANEEKGVGIERKEWYMEEDTEREIDNTAFVLNLSFGTKDEQLK